MTRGRGRGKSSQQGRARRSANGKGPSVKETDYKVARLLAERQLLEHIRALRECVDQEVPEPARSSLHEVCRILEGICCPVTEAVALAHLYAMEAEGNG